MSAPKELKYLQTHEWAQFLDDGTVLLGFTDYAQKTLGDLVFLDIIVDSGDEVIAGESYADIESVKAVFPVYSAVSGIVLEVNTEVVDEPKRINEDPYGSWILKIGNVTSEAELMDAEAYDKFLEE